MIRIRAIQALRPGVGFTMINNDLSQIVWDVEGTTTPTEVEVIAKIAELEAADAQEIIDKAAAKATAQAKLAALGLTAEEIAAL
jgi:hypothetical protein